MMETTVINLFGGPGSGKSTAAAALFSALKTNSYNAELVQEFVKQWAWEGRVPTENDQAYIMGNQIYRESLLYNKVQYIVTDSPIMLSGIYEEYYSGEPRPHTMNYISSFMERNNVSYKNYFIKRTKPYVQDGRFQTEEEAKIIDTYIAEHLKSKNIPFMELPDYKFAADKILIDLNLTIHARVPNLRIASRDTSGEK